MKRRTIADTNVIRDVVDGTRLGPRFGELAACSDVLSVHLSDTSLAEITLQVLRGSIPFSAWRRACPTLTSVVDASDPVIHAEDPFPRSAPVDPEQRRAVRRASWLRLTTSPTLEAFKAPFTMAIGSVRVEQGAMRHEEAEQRLRDDHQLRWAGYVERVAGLLRERGMAPTAEEIFELILADARANFPGGEERVWKYEAYVRAIARFVSLRLSKGTQYAPANERGQNDMLDMKLLSMLGVADYVITEEKKLVAHLQQSGGGHASRLVTVEQLLELAHSWRSER